MAIDLTQAEAFDLSPLAPWRTSYSSDGLELESFFFEPPGPGPFPGIVYNHGSAGLIAQVRPCIDALVAMGYAVLAPIRRGNNDNPGQGFKAFLTAPEYSPEWSKQLVDGLRQESNDVIAAINWMRRHPRIDAERLVVMGSSFGGVMVLLTVGRETGLRAGVSFAGPSITWPHSPALQEELRAAARQARTPLLLLQAQNDHSLEPTYELGLELYRAGKPHEVRIYPALGADAWAGHFLSYSGIPLWRTDVQNFLQRWVEGRTQTA